MKINQDAAPAFRRAGTDRARRLLGLAPAPAAHRSCHPKLLISLGFACQTRFSIDALSGDHRRFPFDFNISTKAAVLSGLATQGKNFAHASDELRIFRMPLEETEGVEKGGIYFWHDYERSDSRRLARHWAAAVADVNEKYAAVWRRFIAELKNAETEKVFVVANSQCNLAEFSDSPADFEAKFGLDEEFYRAVCAGLDAIGVKFYRIIFLNRDLGAAIRLRDAISDPQFESRFVGTLNLPTDNRVAVSVLAADPGTDAALLDRIAGSYAIPGGGVVTIERSRDRTAVAYRHLSRSAREPWAEVSALANGYLFVFEGQNNNHTAVVEDGALYFSNHTRWKPHHWGPRSVSPVRFDVAPDPAADRGPRITHNAQF